MAKKQTPSLLPDPRAEGGNRLTEADRAALVEGCMNLCRKLARTAAGSIPGADLGDLEGEAMLACVEAARQFQPDGTAKFSTFAQCYIQKRLMGLADRQRKAAAALRGMNWDTVVGTAEEPAEPCDGDDGPTEEDRELLVKLDEPGRTAVRMVTFEGFAPDQAAIQLDMSVKDLKLALRNAARELLKLKAKQATPSMFTPTAPVCAMCEDGGTLCGGCFETPAACLCDDRDSAMSVPCPDCRAASAA